MNIGVRPVAARYGPLGYRMFTSGVVGRWKGHQGDAVEVMRSTEPHRSFGHTGRDPGGFAYEGPDASRGFAERIPPRGLFERTS